MNPTRPSDFPDWLPPMLVKELRQGLRGNLFVILFITLQAAMTGVMMFATVDLVSASGGKEISMMIFTVFGIAVLVLQPLRGLRSLADEIRENTLETLAVAGQDAGKMVIGKWAALSAQTILLFVTLLPYLILRYVFGGMNLVSEVVTLGLMLVLSLGMTAAAVAFSAYRSSVVRYTLGCLLLGVAWFIFLWINLLVTRGGILAHFMGLTPPPSPGMVPVFMIFFLHMVYLMLSHGTSLIAPPGEKRAAGRRLASLVMLLALIPAARAKLVDVDFFLVSLFMVTGPALVIALTESGPAVERTSRFNKLGLIGRVAAAFLRPTRESGSLFAVLFFCLFTYVLAEGAGSLSAIRGTSYAMGELSSLLALAGALLVPASWQTFFFREDGQRMGNFLLILLGSAAVVTGLQSLSNDGMIFAFFAWHPLAYLELASSEITVICLCCAIVIHLLAILISTLMRMKREQVRAATLLRQTLPLTTP